MSQTLTLVRPVAASEDKYRYKYFIAIAVTLAAVLELIDTSIVNVAIPHMMGNLGATLDEISWVSTGYIIANVIVIPISAMRTLVLSSTSKSGHCSTTRRSISRPLRRSSSTDFVTLSRFDVDAASRSRSRAETSRARGSKASLGLPRAASSSKSAR